MVKEFVLAEEVEQLVEVEKEGDESDSYDTFLLNQEDPGNSLAFGSHKECPEEMVNVIDDDYDDDQHNIDALIRMKKSGSLELRDAKMQTPILTTSRSPKTNLYSDKGPIIKLMETNDHMSHIPSQSSSRNTKHPKGVVARLTRRHNRMIQTMKKTFVQCNNVDNLCANIAKSLHKEVPQMVVKTTDQILKDNLCLIVQRKDK
ncbi:hypothetical protein Tco_1188858 [Tanacetum coccineum]